jgi:hypothetical protein
MNSVWLQWRFHRWGVVFIYPVLNRKKKQLRKKKRAICLLKTILLHYKAVPEPKPKPPNAKCTCTWKLSPYLHISLSPPGSISLCCASTIQRHYAVHPHLFILSSLSQSCELTLERPQARKPARSDARGPRKLGLNSLTSSSSPPRHTIDHPLPPPP